VSGAVATTLVVIGIGAVVLIALAIRFLPILLHVTQGVPR
jgi:hypothetical protein